MKETVFSGVSELYEQIYFDTCTQIQDYISKTNFITKTLEHLSIDPQPNARCFVYNVLFEDRTLPTGSTLGILINAVERFFNLHKI